MFGDPVVLGRKKNREARITRRIGQPWLPWSCAHTDLVDGSHAAYALNELPQPHVVFACGFLIENPDPWTLST